MSSLWAGFIPYKNLITRIHSRKISYKSTIYCHIKRERGGFVHLVCASGPRGYGHVRALLEKYGRVYAGFVHPNPIQTKKTCVNYLLGQPTSEQNPHRHTAHARSHHLRPILTRAPASLPLQPGLHHARARTVVCAQELRLGYAPARELRLG